jgi:phosphatidylserine/phosphatidylglycerophosphate/cardiolipin synthase-like enzyme
MRLLRSLLAGLLLAACAAQPEGDPGFVDPPASDGKADGPRGPHRPSFVDPASFGFSSRRGACGLSEIGRTVYAAATASDGGSSTIPRDLVLTWRNLAGPSFIDSATRFGALAGLIADAHHEIDLEWHVLDPDSDAFRDVLGGLEILLARLHDERAEGRRRRPLVLRIVTPDWALRPGNNTKAIVREVTARLGVIDPALITVEVGAHRYFGLAVMHVKMAVIDGVVVHVGGGNLSRNQDYDGIATPERDSASIVKGAVGQAALAEFDALWGASATTRYRCLGEACEKLREPSAHAPEVLTPDLGAHGVPEDACLPMIFMAKAASENLFSGSDRNPIGKGFAAAFRAARARLKLSTPNVNERWLVPIVEVVRGGRADVQLLLPFGYNAVVEAVPFFGGGTNTMSLAWLAAGVGLSRIGVGRALDARWFSYDGVHPQRWGGGARGGRHVKYYSVDGALAIVGSTNLDKQSLSRSREVAIAVDDAAVTRAWDAAIYDDDFALGVPLRGQRIVPPSEPPSDGITDEATEDQLAEALANLE